MTQACEVRWRSPWIQDGVDEYGEPRIVRTEKVYAVDGNKVLAYESSAYRTAVAMFESEHPGKRPNVHFLSDYIFSTPYSGE